MLYNIFPCDASLRDYETPTGWACTLETLVDTVIEAAEDETEICYINKYISDVEFNRDTLEVTLSYNFYGEALTDVWSLSPIKVLGETK